MAKLDYKRTGTMTHGSPCHPDMPSGTNNSAGETLGPTDKGSLPQIFGLWEVHHRPGLGLLVSIYFILYFGDSMGVTPGVLVGCSWQASEDQR